MPPCPSRSRTPKIETLASYSFSRHHSSPSLARHCLRLSLSSTLDSSLAVQLQYAQDADARSSRERRWLRYVLGGQCRVFLAVSRGERENDIQLVQYRSGEDLQFGVCRANAAHVPASVFSRRFRKPRSDVVCRRHMWSLSQLTFDSSPPKGSIVTSSLSWSVRHGSCEVPSAPQAAKLNAEQIRQLVHGGLYSYAVHYVGSAPHRDQPSTDL